MFSPKNDKPWLPDIQIIPEMGYIPHSNQLWQTPRLGLHDLHRRQQHYSGPNKIRWKMLEKCWKKIHRNMKLSNIMKIYCVIMDQWIGS